jgi:hypothetical protein
MQSLEPKAQSRFLDMRRQLTDLNYAGSFEVISMDVVQHLLGVLTSTTGSYQELQDRETRLSSDLALAQAQLFPLRKDNSRLTRENHQLHVDNIRQTDASSNMFAEQNASIRKLKDEVSSCETPALITYPVGLLDRTGYAALKLRANSLSFIYFLALYAPFHLHINITTYII